MTEKSRWKSRSTILLKDLRLFGSLYVAQFIVWRALRSKRKAPLVTVKVARVEEE